MASHRVRFKGMLNRSERERLTASGIALESSEPTSIAGIPGAGRPVYTVSVEAESPEQALTKVREARVPDTGTVSNWETEPAA